MAFYRVQTNDSPAIISQKFFGTPYRMKELVLANPLKKWVMRQGYLTFESLQPGELLILPGGWSARHNSSGSMSGLSGTGIAAPADDFAAAQQVITAAQSNLSAGDAETDDNAAITDYQNAVSNASSAATAAAAIAQAIAATNSGANTASSDAANNAGAIASILNDVQATTVRANAQTYAQNAINNAQQAMTDAQNALTLSGSAASSGTGSLGSSATLVSNIATYINQYGCDCSQSLATVTQAFQLAYNADFAAGTYPGPKLVVDGEYGNDTYTAANQVTPATAPGPCYSAGNPCYQRGILPGGGTVPSGLPPVSSKPPSTVVPPVQPPPLVPPAKPSPPGANITNSSFFGAATPWLVGAVAVATGVGLVAFAKKSGHSPVLPAHGHTTHKTARHSPHAKRSHR